MSSVGDTTSAARLNGLYAHLLGPRFHELAAPIRALHREGCVVEAHGVFCVRRGTNRLARMLAWLARLPGECECVDLKLTVTPTGLHEEWRREFGAQLLISFQWTQADGLLTERMGPVEQRFRLEVKDGALWYHTSCVALRLGPLRLWLPRWLSPRISACESAEGEAVKVWVEVQLPIVGRLIRYEGTLTRIEARAC